MKKRRGTGSIDSKWAFQGGRYLFPELRHRRPQNAFIWAFIWAEERWEELREKNRGETVSWVRYSLTKEGKGRTSEEERGLGFFFGGDRNNKCPSLTGRLWVLTKKEKKQQQGPWHVKETRKYSKEKVRQKLLLHIKTNLNNKRFSPSLLKRCGFQNWNISCVLGQFSD